MSFLITPDLQKFMEATDMEGHIYNPSDFMDETLEWIEGRNKKSGCWIPCLYENDLRLLPGTLSVWAGVNGHGKSALIQQFCLWWASGKCTDKEEKILFWSPEMAFKVQVERMIKQSLGVGEPTRKAALYAMKYFTGKIAIYGKEEHVSSREVIALCRWAAANDFTQVVIDSLMMVDLNANQENLYLTQKNFVRMLKQTAKVTNLQIHLVAHMRKGESEQKMGDKMDIKGSSEIADLADYAFIVWKNVKKAEEIQRQPDNEDWLARPDGRLRCVKNRYDPAHPSLQIWFSGGAFSFKASRRAPTPRLIEDIE